LILWILLNRFCGDASLKIQGKVVERMPKVFRTSPPTELVERFLLTTGLRGVHDTTSFCKSSIDLEHFEQLLPELEPYYIPCKAKDYIYIVMTESRAITIIRHLLSSQNIKLDSQEKTTNGDKIIWYRISYDKKLIGEAIIEFN
jgi:hypothetical protein